VEEKKKRRGPNKAKEKEKRRDKRRGGRGGLTVQKPVAVQ